MLDKNDRKYIIRRIITYIAIAMIMFFISSCQAKASTVNQALISPNMARINTTGNSIDSAFNSSNNAYFNFPSNDTRTFNTLYIFFNTLEYHSIQNKKYLFSGHIATSQSNGGKINITGVNVLNGSAKIIGHCNYTGNGLDNYISWSVECDIPEGLKNGAYQNILEFSIVYNGASPTGANSAELFINSKVAMYDNDNTAQAINNVNDTLNDSTPPSSSEISGNTSDWNQYNSSSGTINDLVLMPITLLNSFVNGINNSCSSYDLGELWGEHLILPCINLSQTLGAVWTLIDVIISGVFIFVFGKQCVKIFNDFTNLKSGQIDTLYGGGN